MYVDREFVLTGLFFITAGVLMLFSQLSAAAAMPTPAIHSKPPAIAAVWGAAEDFLFPPTGNHKS